MKCINKLCQFRTGLLIMSFGMIFLTGCGRTKFDIPYDAYSVNSSFTLHSGGEAKKAETFARDLCVADKNYNESAADMSESGAAALLSLDECETLYAKNVHQQMNPASLTKVMTALVALKRGNRDDVLTASSNVKINESGAQVCGLEPGDVMTLDQALRILLMYSANDVAIMIAEQYGGTVENFCEMMNQEAHSLGATNCHFTNPNGLTEDEHFITVYDMYLIFNEACKYDLFKEIISMNSYTTVYHDKNGDEKNFDKKTTNWYLLGEAESPTGITVIGGKTGTTTAAGHCLVLLSSDTSGKSYISIVLQSSERTVLYEEMNGLLGIINK